MTQTAATIIMSHHGLDSPNYSTTEDLSGVGVKTKNAVHMFFTMTKTATLMSRRDESRLRHSKGMAESIVSPHRERTHSIGMY